MKNAHLLADIQELAKIGDWYVDVARRKVIWSKMTCQIHEMPEGTEVDLDDAIAFYVEPHRPIIEKCVNDGVESGRPWDIELQIRTKTGKLKWVRAIGRAVTTEEGALRLEGIFQDIDEKKRTEIQLLENYERIRAYEIALHTHSIVARTDPKGKITYVNDNFCQIAQFDRNELVGKDHRLVNSKTHDKAFFHKMWSTIKSKKSWRGEIKNRAKDGSYYWVDTAITPILDSEGEIREFLAIRNDITRLKQQEEDLAQSNQRYELVAEGARVGIWDWLDLSSDELYWGPRFFRLLGYTMNEVQGSVRLFLQLAHPEDRPKLTQMIQSAKSGEANTNFEFRLKCKNGEYRWFFACTLTERDSNGNPYRVVGSIQDIHENKLSEFALLRSNEDLDQFAYIASHDLREPLRGMRNFAQFLAEDYATKLDEEGIGYLNTIMRLSSRLESYLDSLLYFSRLGREEMAYDKQDINALLQEVADMLPPNPSNKVEVHWENMPTIHCDAVKLTKIFWNLFQNAARYNTSETKRIEIKCEQQEDSLWKFSVKDNGIGIKPEHWERIFVLFKRLHPREEFEGGSGMGLTLVKKAVERHGGKIWLTSEPGKGSTFYFTIKEHKRNEASAR